MFRVRFALVLACMGSGWAAAEVAKAPTHAPDVQKLFAAPLVDLAGQPADLRLFVGRPLIVNFWARWCGPCKVEIPELVALQKAGTGVDIVGLNIESNPATVKDFATAYDINYPVYLTREGGLALMQALGNQKSVLPFTVVLNQHGRVVSTHVGALTKERLASVARLARVTTDDQPSRATP